MMRYVPLRKVVELTGLHPHTLRKYADNGTIPSKRMPNGQRLFAVDKWLEDKPANTVCYARVSSHKQKDDLDRQVQWLQERYPQAEVVKDIGSGLNFKRKGLKAILERAMSGEQLTVVVAHSDRLARFGFDLISWLVERNGGRIVVLGKSAKGSPYSELVQDLMSVLTVFAARMHGLKKYRSQIQEDQAVSDAGAGGEVQAVDGGEQVVLQPDDRAPDQD